MIVPRGYFVRWVERTLDAVIIMAVAMIVLTAWERQHRIVRLLSDACGSGRATGRYQ